MPQLVGGKQQPGEPGAGGEVMGVTSAAVAAPPRPLTREPTRIRMLR